MKFTEILKFWKKKDASVAQPTTVDYDQRIADVKAQQYAGDSTGDTRLADQKRIEELQQLKIQQEARADSAGVGVKPNNAFEARIIEGANQAKAEPVTSAVSTSDKPTS